MLTEQWKQRACASTMEKLLLVTRKLSDHLHSPELQLASAEDLVQSVVYILSDMRTEDTWKELEAAAEEMCTTVGVHLETGRQARQ